MYDGIVQNLIDEFGRLPGIGPKSAQRITFHILQTPGFDVSHLAQLLSEVRDKVRFCEICGNVSEQERCGICRDPRRNLTFICVVPEYLVSALSIPFYLGGTSLLIVVNVTMDTVTQIQSHLLAHQYGDLIKKAKLKGRLR